MPHGLTPSGREILAPYCLYLNIKASIPAGSSVGCHDPGFAGAHRRSFASICARKGSVLIWI